MDKRTFNNYMWVIKDALRANGLDNKSFRKMAKEKVPADDYVEFMKLAGFRAVAKRKSIAKKKMIADAEDKYGQQKLF